MKKHSKKREGRHATKADKAPTIEDRVGRLENRLASLGDDVGVIIGTLGDLQDRFEEIPGRVTLLEGEGTQNREGHHTRWFAQPVRITADQAKSMSDAGGWLIGADLENGWLFIGNLENDPFAEGNGCWHDTHGNEQHGPAN